MFGIWYCEQNTKFKFKNYKHKQKRTSSDRCKSLCGFYLWILFYDGMKGFSQNVYPSSGNGTLSNRYGYIYGDSYCFVCISILKTKSDMQLQY